MQIPAELRAALAHALEGVSRAELARRAARLSQVYRAGRTSPAALRDDLDALAYAVSRMPATFGAVRNALARLQQCSPELDPRSVLDLGAGPGTASWAALEAWPAIESVTQVDSSAALMLLGAKLAEAAPSRALQSARRIGADVARDCPADSTFDLILLSYTLAELSPGQAAVLLKNAWLACSGALVIVEPGTPAGYARILAARNLLLQAGARIAAPCPHELNCPLNPPDWCHFVQRVARSRDHMLLKSAELPYEDEKFTYLAVVREDLFRAPDKDRILAQPEAGKATIQFKLCKRDGCAATVRIARREQQVFKNAKKKNWGDAF